MRRARRTLAAYAIAAAVALLAAGCGSGGGSTGTATGPQDAATGSGAKANAATAPAGTGKTASTHEKAVRFAECMRTNGISQFPDPDASGRLTLDGVVNGSSVDPDGAAWKQAINACKNLEPPGFTGSKATPDQMSARLEFARCVRANGVKDFPDPTRDGPLVDTNRIPSSATSGGMSILNAAMRKCSSFAAKAGVRAGP